jgi:hypothetical protein
VSAEGDVHRDDGPLIAAVGCPRCHHVLARIFPTSGGRLTVEHRSPGIEPERDVEDRHWYRWEVPDGQVEPSSWAGTEAACGTIRCGGRLVLEQRRVRQLADRAGELAGPVRWDPTEADVERSEGLRPTPTTFALRSPAAASLAMRLKLSDPPPLAHVRRIKGSAP